MFSSFTIALLHNTLDIRNVVVNIILKLKKWYLNFAKTQTWIFLNTYIYSEICNSFRIPAILSFIVGGQETLGINTFCSSFPALLDIRPL